MNDVITLECTKCHGTGHLSAFAGIDNGRCWACAGVGNVFTTEKREKARKSAAKRREANRVAKAANSVNSRMAAAKAEGMTLLEWHDTVCGCGEDCSREWNGGVMGKSWDAS